MLNVAYFIFFASFVGVGYFLYTLGSIELLMKFIFILYILTTITISLYSLCACGVLSNWYKYFIYIIKCLKSKSWWTFFIINTIYNIVFYIIITYIVILELMYGNKYQYLKGSLFAFLMNFNVFIYRLFIRQENIVYTHHENWWDPNVSTRGFATSTIESKIMLFFKHIPTNTVFYISLHTFKQEGFSTVSIYKSKSGNSLNNINNKKISSNGLLSLGNTRYSTITYIPSNLNLSSCLNYCGFSTLSNTSSRTPSEKKNKFSWK